MERCDICENRFPDGETEKKLSANGDPVLVCKACMPAWNEATRWVREKLPHDLTE